MLSNIIFDADVVKTCVLWNLRFVIIELFAPLLNSIYEGLLVSLYPYIVFKFNVLPLPSTVTVLLIIKLDVSLYMSSRKYNVSPSLTSLFKPVLVIIVLKFSLVKFHVFGGYLVFSFYLLLL